MSNAKDPAASPTPELLDNCSECNGKGGQCYACGAGAGRTLSTTVSKQAHIGAQDTNKSKIGGVPSDKDIKATRSRSKSVDKSSGSKVVDSSSKGADSREPRHLDKCPRCNAPGYTGQCFSCGYGTGIGMF